MGGCIQERVTQGVDSPGASTLCFSCGLEAQGNPQHGESIPLKPQ